MTSNQPSDSRHNNGKPDKSSGKTVDLQGVATFASLVELIAQEIGTAPGRIQGLLPNGPASFEELVGEVVMNKQGFQRRLLLRAQPGSPLTMQFHCAWRDQQSSSSDNGTIAGIEAQFFLGAPVEQILPQGRALARYVENIFSILDSMVTLGQSGKLSSMSIPIADVEAFEHEQSQDLVRNFSPKRNHGGDV